jgi:hypothetical protein
VMPCATLQLADAGEVYLEGFGELVEGRYVMWARPRRCSNSVGHVLVNAMNVYHASFQSPRCRDRAVALSCLLSFIMKILGI